MISAAELTGIVYVLGAVTFEEICAVDQEIAELRGSVYGTSSMQELCTEAVQDHLLESVAAEDVCGAEADGTTYFIAGPNAFPEIPPELSQIIDILNLSMRKVDMGIIATKLLQNFRKRIHRLEIKIGSIEGNNEEIQKLESQYSDLFNLYYDYDSWLPGRFEAAAERLMEISKKIEHLKQSK